MIKKAMIIAPVIVAVLLATITAIAPVFAVVTVGTNGGHSNVSHAGGHNTQRANGGDANGGHGGNANGGNACIRAHCTS